MQHSSVGWSLHTLYTHCYHVLRAGLCWSRWQAVPVEMGRSTTLQRTRCCISPQCQSSWARGRKGCISVCILHKSFCSHRVWQGKIWACAQKLIFWTVTARSSIVCSLREVYNVLNKCIASNSDRWHFKYFIKICNDIERENYEDFVSDARLKQVIE